MTGASVPSTEFQSTLSVRRATTIGRSNASNSSFQSTLSVRRATQRGLEGVGHGLISIHALRKESDRKIQSGNAGGALISIHALRKESDPPLAPHGPRKSNFNPRSP
mgnify:CR=1 FL=1